MEVSKVWEKGIKWPGGRLTWQTVFQVRWAFQDESFQFSLYSSHAVKLKFKWQLFQDKRQLMVNQKNWLQTSNKRICIPFIQHSEHPIDTFHNEPTHHQKVQSPPFSEPSEQKDSPGLTVSVVRKWGEGGGDPSLPRPQRLEVGLDRPIGGDTLTPCPPTPSSHVVTPPPPRCGLRVLLSLFIRHSVVTVVRPGNKTLLSSHFICTTSTKQQQLSLARKLCCFDSENFFFHFFITSPSGVHQTEVALLKRLWLKSGHCQSWNILFTWH